MLMTIDPEKTHNIIQYSLMKMILSILGIEGSFCNLIKGIYEKPTS